MEQQITSRQSRIDFWLIKNSTKAKILPTPLTDHKAIQIHISSSSNCLKKLYCKVNSSVLCHNALKLGVKELIQIFWNEAQVVGVYGIK